jgi:hypothetical protein
LNNSQKQTPPEKEYILLGGDVDIVPTAYVLTNSYSKTEDSGDKWLPCDMYYACLKNESSWYNNQHFIVANNGSSDQFNQDGIYVARCPARTKSEVATFVDKVIRYEKNPPSNWGNKILFCGNYVHYSLPDPNPSNINGYISDVDTLSHLMAKEDIYPYWNGDVEYLFDSRTSIPAYNQFEEDGYGVGHISTRRVAKEIKNNYSLIHVYAHGTDSTWEVGDGTFPFTQLIADTIQSVYPKVILTEACHTNSFDKKESMHHCLSEAFMRNPNSGVVAYIGSSRQGISNPDSSHVDLAYSDKFSSCFLASLFNPENLSDGHLGELVFNGKTSGLGLYSLCDDDSIRRWLNVAINSLGDPEMQLFTSMPQSFPDSSVQGELKNNTFVVHINTGGIEDYTATIFEWTYGDKSMTSYEHLPSVCLFDTSSDSVLFVLHKQNYKPCYLKAYMDVFIQNDTIKTNKSFQGSRIYAGKAVTDKYTHGNVVIAQGGRAEILSNKFINLQHGFEVQPKAVLKMDVGSLVN